MPKSKVTNLQEAYLSSQAPNFIDPDKYQTPAMVRGLKYEAQVKEQLKELFTEDTKVFSGPWIKYFDGLKWRYAQPDIVLFNEHLVVGEIKLTWRPGAVRKLANLYEPLCNKVWPDYKIKKVQICKGIKKNCKVEKWHQLQDIMNPDKPDHFDVHWF